jgi:fructooligosaccharide transport system substrate-binding protein
MSSNHLRRLVLLAATAVLVVGCGSAPAQPASGPPGAPASLTTAPVSLRILRYQPTPAEQDLFEAWKQEFTASHPNITFQDEVVPFGQLADKIQASVAAGDPPDIFYIDGPNTKTYAYLGILAPLDAYLPPGFKQDIVSATLEEQSYQGQLYSMPDRQTAPALFYNKDLTDKAGIVPPTELDKAWTWDQALDAWKKLQVAYPDLLPLEPSRFGAGGAGFYYRDGIFIRSAGDPKAAPDSSAYKTYAAISQDGKTVEGYVDSPEAVTAMQWFQDLTMKWGVTSKVGIPNAFLDGKAVMSIDHSGLIGRMKTKFPNGGFNLGVTPMPYFKTPLVMTGSNAAGLSAKSQHPAEAMAFLNYVYNDDNRLRYWKANQNEPARTSLYDKIPEYATYPLSLFKQELLTIGVSRPSTPGWAAYDSLINTAIKDISLGAPVEETLQKAAKSIDEQLAQFP